MSTNGPVDPLQALQSALAVPADSKEQLDLLTGLRENLETHPNPLPILCTTLIKTVSGAGDSLLKRWVLDLLQFGIAKSSLPIETRTQLASQTLEPLASLLNDPNPLTVKVVVQCFCSVYPLVFRFLCTNRQFRPQWDILAQSKAKILEMVWLPNVSAGVRLSALKFMQRVVLVQTRGVSDPRLQNKSDPNLSFCPADHPFIPVSALEAEGIKLIEGIITILYTSQNPDMVTAVLNSWSTLAKQRPSQTHIVVSALTSWTPAALSNFPASSVKSVEKVLRILLMHLHRTPQGSTFGHQITEALAQQALRMEQAAANERNRKTAAASEESRKRPIETLADEANDAKRMKTDHTSNGISGVLATFDFTSLPANLVTDLIVASLQTTSQSILQAAVQTYRQTNGLIPAPTPLDPRISTEENVASTSKAIFKSEPVDPLQMDIEEEELDYEPDKLNLQLSGSDDAILPDNLEEDDNGLQLIDFRIPPPQELSQEERDKLVRSSMLRICDTFEDQSVRMDDPHLSIEGDGLSELGLLLLVRMVTRIVVPSPINEDDNQEDFLKDSTDGDAIITSNILSYQDKARQTICDYVVKDFPSRVRLAITWLNEEWYNDRVRSTDDPHLQPNYDKWLHKIVFAYKPFLDSKDRTFPRFILDIPHVPSEILHLLRGLCLDPERMQVGFTALREFVIQRPPLRSQALDILLELTTHPAKVTRGAAIITVKRWVPETHPMNDMVRMFALQLLRRLQSRPTSEHKLLDVDNGIDGQSDAMEDGEMDQGDIIQTEYLSPQLELPAEKAVVLQHVELIFALCVKVPDFLDEIFASYGQMDISVQEAIQDLITALIRSLGPSHGKLLTLLRTFPPGAESLALRVLNIFTENGRPSVPLVALVKGLVAERDLDARFLIPIIAEMDKPDIMRYLPRIVSVLNDTPETKALVKSVFESIVATPPQTFGSVTSNLPRVRQSELLQPAELMVLLHEAEKEIGRKAAMDAISVCFSMTDVFRSEILAVVMQQIVDEPVLPVLFLRTVIQAVTTYKSLVGFVSTTLLSRLITKKIWTNPHLWEGFIRCAKVIAPASFGALLQLPKDQLRELVEKQPGLKSGLRDYVLKKAGNRARQAGFLELFGDEEDQTPISSQAQAQAQPPQLQPQAVAPSSA